MLNKKIVLDYISETFPGRGCKKLKAETLDGPQIRKPVKDQTLIS